LWSRISGKEKDLAQPKTQKQRWENYKNGRERPHFLGFQPPKKFFGVAPALRHLFGACGFPTAAEELRSQFEEAIMSIVKKAPAIVTREVRIEEPVSVLLDDYAQFIESNSDHVVNAVLKKTLWRDQDYRKWRESRRSRSGETLSAAIEQGKK
jgi:hypothetical protein